MVNWGSDEKFSLNLYSNCEKHDRFSAGSAQKVQKQFSVEHYAGYVEYTIQNWLEKNKDQLPAASVQLLESSEFQLIGQIKVKWSSFSLFVLPLATQIVSGIAEIHAFRGVKDHHEVTWEAVLRLIKDTSCAH